MPNANFLDWFLINSEIFEKEDQPKSKYVWGRQWRRKRKYKLKQN